jgi:hypothetical protein
MAAALEQPVAEHFFNSVIRHTNEELNNNIVDGPASGRPNTGPETHRSSRPIARVWGDSSESRERFYLKLVARPEQSTRGYATSRVPNPNLGHASELRGIPTGGYEVPGPVASLPQLALPPTLMRQVPPTRNLGCFWRD